VAWPPRVPDSVTAKGIKRMSGRLLTPSENFSNLVFSTRHVATSGDGGLETPNKPEEDVPRHTIELLLACIATIVLFFFISKGGAGIERLTDDLVTT
jgi:hypothetical protein